MSDLSLMQPLASLWLTSVGDINRCGRLQYAQDQDSDTDSDPERHESVKLAGPNEHHDAERKHHHAEQDDRPYRKPMLFVGNRRVSEQMHQVGVEIPNHRGGVMVDLAVVVGGRQSWLRPRLACP